MCTSCRPIACNFTKRESSTKSYLPINFAKVQNFVRTFSKNICTAQNTSEIIPFNAGSPVCVFLKLKMSQLSKLKSLNLNLFRFHILQLLNRTGEDWKDAKLYLITGMPSIGQSPPKLTVQNVDVGTQKHSYRKAAR